MVAWFTKDLLALDTMDFWFGNMSLYLTTGLYLYLFCVAWGTHKGLAELRLGSCLQLPRPVAILITWVAPLIMLTIFVARSQPSLSCQLLLWQSLLCAAHRG